MKNGIHIAAPNGTWLSSHSHQWHQFNSITWNKRDSRDYLSYSLWAYAFVVFVAVAVVVDVLMMPFLLEIFNWMLYFFSFFFSQLLLIAYASIFPFPLYATDYQCFSFWNILSILICCEKSPNNCVSKKTALVLYKSSENLLLNFIPIESTHKKSANVMRNCTKPILSNCINNESNL